MESLFVAGISYRSAPVEVREQLALSEEQILEILPVLRAGAGLSEAMVLATCNRVEVYGVADPSDGRPGRAFDLLGERRGVVPGPLRPLVYTRTGGGAVRHCFRVASSLDSMIVGEPQILGQVKNAFDLARRGGTVGPGLHALVTQAFAVAKKVRNETALGRYAVSVSFVAVELARKICGDLRGAAALLIGAGKMGELAARHLVEQGVSPLYVANRTCSRALQLAGALGGSPVAFDDWQQTLRRVDIVITCTGAPHPLVTKDAVGEALDGRRPRPLFFVDIAVPRDVEPSVSDLDNVFRYDVDDLRQVAETNMRERWREALRAEALVARAVDAFLARGRDRGVVPIIVSLRARIDAIRRGEVARALARLRDPSPETRGAVEALSSAIANKILHAPTTKLRESARQGASDGWSAAVCELFALEPPPAGARVEPGAAPH